MKIKDKDLRANYQASLREEENRGRDCSKIEGLINTFSKESAEKDKLKVIDHITECGQCYRKFEAIKPFFLEGKRIKKELEKITLSELEVKKLKQSAKEKLSELQRGPKKRGKASILPRVRLAYISVVAAMVMVVLGAVLIFRGPDDTVPDIVRGTEDTTMKLVKPVGALKKPPVVFEWTQFPEAEEYQVVLLDAELTRIWTSERIKGTQLLVLPELSESLIRKNIYYWKVIVQMENGTIKEFGLQEFKIQKH